MPAHVAQLLDRLESSLEHELYLFALYRILGACLIVGLVFSPLSTLIPAPASPELASWVSLFYLGFALALFVGGRHRGHIQRTASIGAVIDILAATLISHALPGAEAGIAMMLLFNIAATASLLPLYQGLAIAALAGFATVMEYMWSRSHALTPQRSLLEMTLFTSSYFLAAFICQRIAQRAQTSEALAERRQAQVANLSEINELIIRRMRTGVMVVDGDGSLALVNEAAAALFGRNPLSQGRPKLFEIAPQLAIRLRHWRNHQPIDKSPLHLDTNRPKVQPHFVRLLADSDIILIFLDDPQIVSRRVESLTLTTMGRFSASLAHEIRNPLAAIQHAAQLLEESDHLDSTDQRLLKIVLQQCKRTNGIVQNVLGLARRERSIPESVDLADFIPRLVQEYQETMSADHTHIEVRCESAPLPALFDIRQLHQILATLLHNAMIHGHGPDQTAHILFWAGKNQHDVVIEVTDNGPGVPEEMQDRLFQPFFTTSEHGTGLGLYIAHELCNANQGRLLYTRAPGGGACFQLHLPTLHSWLPH